MTVVTVRRESDISSAIQRDDFPPLWCLRISACCAPLAATGRPTGLTIAMLRPILYCNDKLLIE